MTDESEVNGDSRTPKFTTYEAEEAYKLGRKEGAAASEFYHLGAVSNPAALGSAGRPEPSTSANFQWGVLSFGMLLGAFLSGVARAFQ